MLKIWDKQENIGLVSADDYMLNNPLTVGDVLLIVNDTTGTVEQVLNVNVLRSNLNLDATLTALEVGEAYLASLEVIPDGSISIEDRVKATEDAISLLMGV